VLLLLPLPVPHALPWHAAAAMLGGTDVTILLCSDRLLLQIHWFLLLLWQV
jgi:hypothetical protein